MPRTIEIDDDVYEFLRQQSDFGETPSATLRRLHRLTAVSNPPASVNGKADAPPSILEAYTGPGATLLKATSDPSFIHRKVTKKFLRLLSAAHREKGEQEFQKLLEIGGRQRKYFSRSSREIELSGTSTKPQQIPGTTFWVMTNADTAQKQMILTNALQVLEYPPDVIQHIIKALV
jgi:negative modulator of initiation of replication